MENLVRIDNMISEMYEESKAEKKLSNYSVIIFVLQALKMTGGQSIFEKLGFTKTHDILLRESPSNNLNSSNL